MKRVRGLLVGAGMAALAGCALLQGGGTQEPAPATQVDPHSARPASRTASDADTLLLYYQHLRRLPPAGVGREHEIARAAFSRSRSDYDRVRLALVLAVPGTPVSDDARALELLEPLAKRQESGLQGLAYLLASHLQERKRLDATAQGLQQKLDALKSLERTMIERKR